MKTESKQQYQCKKYQQTPEEKWLRFGLSLQLLTDFRMKNVINVIKEMLKTLKVYYKKRKEKEKEKKMMKLISLPNPLTRTVDRLQNYLKFSSK